MEGGTLKPKEKHMSWLGVETDMEWEHYWLSTELGCRDWLR